MPPRLKLTLQAEATTGPPSPPWETRAHWLRLCQMPEVRPPLLQPLLLFPSGPMASLSARDSPSARRLPRQQLPRCLNASRHGMQRARQVSREQTQHCCSKLLRGNKMCRLRSSKRRRSRYGCL